MGSEQRSKLLKRLSNQRKINKKDKFWQDVEQRVKDAETAPEHVLDEVAAYAVTEHLNGNANLPKGLVKWVKDFIAALKAAVFKYTGFQFGKVSPQELIAMTEAYVDKATGKERDVQDAMNGVALASKESTSKQAHKTAQRNAALPISEGGLGLPADNTAMDRAKAMGYIVDINDVVVEDNEYEAKRKAVPRGYFKGADTEGVSGIGDAAARLQTFYHGTGNEISAFDINHPDKQDAGWIGKGIYLAGTQNYGQSNANIKSAYTPKKILSI